MRRESSDRSSSNARPLQSVQCPHSAPGLWSPRITPRKKRGISWVCEWVGGWVSENEQIRCHLWRKLIPLIPTPPARQAGSAQHKTRRCQEYNPKQTAASSPPPTALEFYVSRAEAMATRLEEHLLGQTNQQCRPGGSLWGLALRTLSRLSHQNTVEW